MKSFLQHLVYHPNRNFVCLLFSFVVVVIVVVCLGFKSWISVPSVCFRMSRTERICGWRLWRKLSGRSGSIPR